MKNYLLLLISVSIIYLSSCNNKPKEKVLTEKEIQQLADSNHFKYIDSIKKSNLDKSRKDVLVGVTGFRQYCLDSTIQNYGDLIFLGKVRGHDGKICANVYEVKNAKSLNYKGYPIENIQLFTSIGDEKLQSIGIDFDSLVSKWNLYETLEQELGKPNEDFDYSEGKSKEGKDWMSIFASWENLDMTVELEGSTDRYNGLSIGMFDHSHHGLKSLLTQPDSSINHGLK